MKLNYLSCQFLNADQNLKKILLANYSKTSRPDVTVGVNIT